MRSEIFSTETSFHCLSEKIPMAKKMEIQCNNSFILLHIFTHYYYLNYFRIIAIQIFRQIMKFIMKREVKPISIIKFIFSFISQKDFEIA